MPLKTTAVISPKGQIVIPSGLRKRYGLRQGTTVLFQEERGRLILSPSNYDAIDALQGSLQGLPIEVDLEEERNAVRKRENAR